MREPHFIDPSSVDSAQDILVGDVLYPRGLVLFHIAPEDYALDLVLRLAQPAFFEVVQDDFDASLGACDEASVGDCDGEVAW